VDIRDLKNAVTNAEKAIVSTAHIDDARTHRERRTRAREALRRPGITENEVWGASNRVSGSPHLPVPISQQSVDAEPIEPCAPRDVILATAWIIAWAPAVVILANVIGSI
jgi:hypothetical protein